VGGGDAKVGGGREDGPARTPSHPAPHAARSLNRLWQVIDKLHGLYTVHLRQTWVPRLLYRLNREIDRLQAADRALGVPAVPEPPEGAALDALRSSAIAAGRLLLHPQALQPKVRECGAALKVRLEALARRAAELTAGPELMALLTEMREVAQQTEIRYDGCVRSALEADASEFKMGRFAPFVSAVVSRVEAQKFVPEAQQRPLDELLREAAEATTDWVESCRAERLELRARVDRVAPVKAQVLQLLGLASDADVPQLAALERVDLARSTVEGGGIEAASRGAPATFRVTLRAGDGAGCAGLAPTGSLLCAGRAVPVSLTDSGGGAYEGRYTVPEEVAVPAEGATFELAVELHGCGLGGSPFGVRVRNEWVRLTFASAFDTNGVLHHIGTAGGREAYRNPHEAGRVVAAMSSVNGGNPQYGSPERFVQHQHARPVYNFTNGEPNSWMSVDLGEGRSLRPDHYCLRHDQHNSHAHAHGFGTSSSHALRHWRLEGSHDGRAWVALRTHTNDASIAGASMATAAWAVEGATEAFRHFRVLQTGQNSCGFNFSNADCLMCAGIELYGAFREPAA
jgi:hypothetical protein